MSDALYIAGDALMALSVVGAVVFAGSYAFFFAWRRTAAGRSLMYFVLAFVAWALQSLAARLDPLYWGREWLRLIVYACIALTIWRLVVVLWWSWKRTPFEIEPRKHKE